MTMLFPSTYPSSRKPLTEGFEAGELGERSRHEISDPWNFLRLLASAQINAMITRIEKYFSCFPHRSAEHEFSCFSSGPRSSALVTQHCHLMTLSARASTFGGIVRPICLAVFRLITNSNFVGCSTGRSAGLAPFEDLVHVHAARRYDQHRWLHRI